MIIGDGTAATAADALAMLLPREREAARAEALGLARRLEFLSWQERPKVLDDFFWDEAKSRLDNERVTAVINRQGHAREHGAAVRAYARHCRGAVTAALVMLAEPARAAVADDPAAALAHRLSLQPEHQDAAEAAGWGGDDAARRERLAAALAGLPGHAFLLLATIPNDSAESFLARDAFFAAMLGQA